MYIRKKKTKSTPVLQLVQSYRDNQGNPRQKILLSLGNCDIPQELWHPIVEHVENTMNNSTELFEPTKEVRDWAEKIVKHLQAKQISSDNNIPEKIVVNPADITVEDVKQLGPELVALRAYEALDIENILKSNGFSSIQIRDTAISAINRLCDPVSEHALPQWINSTALSDLFHDRLDNLGDDRFYRISDALLKVKKEFEERISAQEQTIFNCNRSIYLYDLTNTYFEGVMASNSRAKRGHSKEKRSDAPLISCGMVLDREGCIVQHTVYDGNIGETGTLKMVVEDIKENTNERPVIIMDSGISSKENLEFLKSVGCDYITVAKRPSRLAYQEWFQDLHTFRVVPDRKKECEVKIKTIETESEKLVACISRTRAEKEKAILSRSEEKYRADLQKLEKSIKSGRIKNSVKIQQRIGRLAQKHSRVSRYYNVTYEENLMWERKDNKYEEADAMSGGYILRTSRKDLTDEEIWHLYIMLTKVESGFRTLKSDLGLRPVFHQTANRSEGHIFLTIIAYHLLHWIEMTLKRNGMNISWKAVRRVLETHSYTTIVMPSESSGVVRIRKPSTPDSTQKEIYKLLNVDLKSLPITKTVSNF